MPLPAPGTGPGFEQLNAPPPSPALLTGSAPGPSPTPGGLGVPPIPSGMLPPELLSGILKGGEQMTQMVDAFAQATPDLAADWAMVKDVLLRTLAKILQSGGQPPSPTAVGTSFPGGGIDRGGAPLAPLTAQ